MADEMNKVGHPWHQTTVAKVEAGQRPATLGEAVALTRILGGDLEEMTSNAVDNIEVRLFDLRKRQRDALMVRLSELEEQYQVALANLDRLSVMVQDALQQRDMAMADVSRISDDLHATTAAINVVAEELERHGRASGQPM